MLGNFAANFGVVYVLLSLSEGGRTQGAASLYLFPCNGKKILLGDNCPYSLPKENRAGVFKLVCRAVGRHGICSSQNGMHSGVWRERMFGCEGFVYARSLAG